MAAKITVKKLFAKTFPLMIFTTVSHAGFTAGKRARQTQPLFRHESDRSGIRGRPAGNVRKRLYLFRRKGARLFQAEKFKARAPALKWERSQHELMGPPNERDLKAVKNFAKAAEERSLFVILDMHNYGRRSLDGKKQ